MAVTFGSLFSGIGGLDLGLERAGLRCLWQVEIDPYCRRVLGRHWPHVERYEDVRTLDPGRLSGVDLVAGGDPCQGNSKAGAPHSRPVEDLGRHLVRVVEAVHPPLVLRENPYPSRDGAVWPWQRMRAELERLGYAVVPFRLRSCCLGGFTRRDRVWLLGHRPDADRVGLAGIDGAGVPGGVAGGTPGREVRGGRTDGLPAPRVCRGRAEVPALVDRLRGLGNAVDPACAEWVGRLIMGAINGEA
ncbi:MAG: DNA cytosine methyltransferase [Acidimicrobiales bacterium]|nr:DNA cytosine methyltransferase [Acidimicrobiales bacterium]